MVYYSHLSLFVEISALSTLLLPKPMLLVRVTAFITFAVDWMHNMHDIYNKHKYALHTQHTHRLTKIHKWESFKWPRARFGAQRIHIFIFPNRWSGCWDGIIALIALVEIRKIVACMQQLWCACDRKWWRRVYSRGMGDPPIFVACMHPISHCNRNQYYHI